MNSSVVLYLAALVTLVASSSFFYTGMFKKNDYLVAKDRIYKPRGPLKFNYLKYGRVLKCPITYFRLSHRQDNKLGTPHVKIIRGGLKKKYIVAKIWVYNQPIDAIAYVGCDGSVRTTPAPSTTTDNATSAETSTAEPDAETTTDADHETTSAEDGTTESDTTPGDATDNPIPDTEAPPPP